MGIHDRPNRSHSDYTVVTAVGEILSEVDVEEMVIWGVSSDDEIESGYIDVSDQIVEAYSRIVDQLPTDDDSIPEVVVIPPQLSDDQ